MSRVEELGKALGLAYDALTNWEGCRRRRQWAEILGPCEAPILAWREQEAAEELTYRLWVVGPILIGPNTTLGAPADYQPWGYLARRSARGDHDQ
jgi:hypothetical protein